MKDEDSLNLPTDWRGFWIYFTPILITGEVSHQASLFTFIFTFCESCHRQCVVPESFTIGSPLLPPTVGIDNRVEVFRIVLL